MCARPRGRVRVGPSALRAASRSLPEIRRRTSFLSQPCRTAASRRAFGPCLACSIRSSTSPQQREKPSSAPHHSAADARMWSAGSEPRRRFPIPRVSSEERYELGNGIIIALFEDVLDYCRETIETGGSLGRLATRPPLGGDRDLRCLLSSPAAAASVLDARVHRWRKPYRQTRAGTKSTRRTDPAGYGRARGQRDGQLCANGPARRFSSAAWSDPERSRLLRYRDRARELSGPSVRRKLERLIEVVRDLLSKGRRPIVFCRFIPTANYVQESLSKSSRRRPSLP